MDRFNPIEAENGQNTPSSTTHATPSITTTRANTMLVTAHAYASSQNWTADAGLTEAFDQRSGAAGAAGQSVTGTYQLQALAGSSGAKRSTAASSADVGNTHILALRPPTVPPTVTLTSPSEGATFTAPAAIQLSATATDTDGTITSVAFYHGTTLQNIRLIARVTAAPYTFTWTDVAPGSYSLFAIANDDDNGGTASARVNITVNAGIAQLYFVHVDHLNTPRVVADASGTTVWRWDQMEPFGVNVPNEDPDANSVAFEFPLRFQGQYADKETNLHYNYFRDCYDPALGRYCESDPIGLGGGLNTYAYVGGNPISFTDPLGLQRGGPPPRGSWYNPLPLPNQRPPTWSQNLPNEAGAARQTSNLPVNNPAIPGEYPGINVPWSMPPGIPNNSQMCGWECPRSPNACSPGDPPPPIVPSYFAPQSGCVWRCRQGPFIGPQ